MTTFSSTLAEAAWAIANCGFAQDGHCDPQSSGGWDGLLQINAVTLLNVGEADLSAYFRAEHYERTLLVWLRKNDVGHVSVVKYAHDDSLNAQAVEHDYYASTHPHEFGDFS